MEMQVAVSGKTVCRMTPASTFSHTMYERPSMCDKTNFEPTTIEFRSAETLAHNSVYRVYTIHSVAVHLDVAVCD